MFSDSIQRVVGRVCFVAPFALPVLEDLDVRSVGGAELQQVLIARQLRLYGWSVSFVVADYGIEPRVLADGIDVIPAFRVDSRGGLLGTPVRSAALGWAMRTAGADVYVTRAGMVFVLPIALASRVLRKPFVYLGAHDRNFDPDLQRGAPWAVRAAFRWGIRTASAVVPQSQHQRELLLRHFGVAGEVIPSGYFIPEYDRARAGDYILWIGSTSAWKRPALFLELARRVPEIPCVMIVAPANRPNLLRSLEREAGSLGNLDFRGFVPLSQVDGLIRDARLLVSTSSAEGFPSVFVQAWAQGVPVVSMGVDPDEVICRERVGVHVRELDALVAAVHRIWSDEELAIELGSNARRHAAARHDIRVVGRSYHELLQRVLQA